MSWRVAGPMVHDTSFRVDHQGLWDRVIAVHQKSRGLRIGPAKAKAESHIAQEFFHASGGSTRVFRRQSYELHVASCISFTHLLILRNFSTARRTPGRPDVYYDDFAVEVLEAEAATVERVNLPFAKTGRQETQRRGRDDYL